MFFLFLLYFEKVWRKRNLNIENSLFGYNMIPEQGIFMLKFFIKELALTSCRVAGGLVLWRQNSWSLILQGFCGFCLFVWECQMVYFFAEMV